MMAEKARLFRDDDALERILSAKSPAESKAIGRSVRGFVEADWQAHRYAAVVRGNLAKFSQHPELRSFLLATGNKVLVEASPVDRVWGIGLAATDSKAEDPLAWRGLNLLGFALVEVRRMLAASHR